MNSKMPTPGWMLVFPLLLTGLLIQSACEIQSGNETVRNVSLNVAGTYRNSSGIPARQSGSRITSLTLTQSGDRLFAIDNLGARWTGSIGRADQQVASVTLKGMTSAGGEVVITGNIRVSGNDGVLSGLWVEPGFTSDLFAEANNVQPSPEPTPTPLPNATPTPVPNQTGGTNTGTGGGTGVVIQI